MESGSGGAAVDRLGEVPLPRSAHGERSASLLAAGPLFVLAFVAEGVFDHLRPPLGLSFLLHMALTAAFLGAMGTYWAFLRHRVPTPGLRGLRNCSAFLIAWGFVSCLAQDKVMENLAFWAMWSAGVFAGWWVIPCLLRDLDIDRRTRLLGLVLTACVLLASVGLLKPSERLSGIFGSATTTGRLMALALVLGVAWWVSGRRPPAWLPYVTMLSGVLLIMTRTRASIAAAILGISFIMWDAAFGRGVRGRLSQGRALNLLVILPAALFTVLLLGWFSEEEAIRYLRLEGGVERVYASRSMNWEQSWAEFPTYGFFGKGYLSKFGDSYRTVNVMGLEFPKYQWTTAADPLNMLLLMTKQIGFVGGLLLAAVLVCLVGAVRRLHGTARAVAGGWLAAGLVFGLLDGNWLVSFGHPVDRLSVVAIAAMLSAPDATAHASGSRRWMGDKRAERSP